MLIKILNFIIILFDMKHGIDIVINSKYKRQTGEIQNNGGLVKAYSVDQIDPE